MKRSIKLSASMPGDFYLDPYWRINWDIGMIPIRKNGKLPYNTISESYTLEYGEEIIEIHEDAIQKGERVVVIDDLMATGGTISAAANLVEKLGGEIIECSFVLELPDLNGRKNSVIEKYFRSSNLKASDD